MNTLNTTLTLEKLLRSATRAEILWTFYQNPQLTYGLRELGRKINRHPNAVLREIQFLRRANIVNTKITPTKHIYSLNYEHPFFYELLGLFHKSYGLGGLLLHNKNLFKNITYMLITSFYLFKLEKDKYDIDLLIVGSPNLEYTATLINKLEVKLDNPITYSVISEADFLKRREAKDPFIWNILAKPFVLLMGDLATIYGN